MLGRGLNCTVTEVQRLTDSTVMIRFRPDRKISYEPGQFLSVEVPVDPGDPAGKAARPLRRPYSFATAPELGRKNGYELCVTVVPGGAGSGYLSRLRPSDVFRAYGPFGDFAFERREGRLACFVCTGSGVAPFRAMVLSKEFQADPVRSLCVFGARTADEIIYPGFFEAQGVEIKYALSRNFGKIPAGLASSSLFDGRVTDYLQQLPADWPWDQTDFYLCGNGLMVRDVRRFLLESRGVGASAVHQEIYFTSTAAPALKLAA